MKQAPARLIVLSMIVSTTRHQKRGEGSSTLGAQKSNSLSTEGLHLVFTIALSRDVAWPCIPASEHDDFMENQTKTVKNTHKKGRRFVPFGPDERFYCGDGDNSTVLTIATQRHAGMELRLADDSGIAEFCNDRAPTWAFQLLKETYAHELLLDISKTPHLPFPSTPWLLNRLCQVLFGVDKTVAKVIWDKRSTPTHFCALVWMKDSKQTNEWTF
ncbi:hypothetical protein DL96DRAFT_1561969 [Flagelloscypha sp. PMI_526]|nr:hypothetical protein DL96DRAFT_1561969 [Flagelloscypha sp. PMI_526]